MNHLTLSNEYNKEGNNLPFGEGLKKTINALISLFTAKKDHNSHPEYNNTVNQLRTDLELYKELFLLQEECDKNVINMTLQHCPELIRLRLQAAGLCINMTNSGSILGPDEDTMARLQFVESAIDNKDATLADVSRKRLHEHTMLKELEKELQEKYHIMYKGEKYDNWIIYFGTGQNKSAAMVAKNESATAVIPLHEGISALIKGTKELSIQKNT